jgi:hypothetical protein
MFIIRDYIIPFYCTKDIHPTKSLEHMQWYMDGQYILRYWILWFNLWFFLIDSSRSTAAVFLFFYVNNKSFFFISNNNCRLLTINIVSFIFSYYRESKTPFCLHYEKSILVSIVSRKINWQKPRLNKRLYPIRV